MTAAEITALGNGYTLALLVAAIGGLLVGLIALTLRYTAQEVARAQHAQDEAQAA